MMTFLVTGTIPAYPLGHASRPRLSATPLGHASRPRLSATPLGHASRPRLSLLTSFVTLLLAAFPMSALQAAPVHSDPNDGGGVGGNAASSPGPGYSWVSNVGGVSTATGNKLTEIPTVSWVARGGLTVDLTLYHNSQVSFNSPSRGAKWSLIYDTALKSDASGIVHMGWGNGSRYDFGYANGVYSPPPGIHDRLIANGSPITSYDLIKTDQTDWHFAPYGSPSVFLLTSISDENGNAITVNRAANNGGMLGITDPTGRKVTFGFNSTYYTSITDPLGRVFSFGFDGSGNMSSVTYPNINGTSYSLNLGYDANHNVTSIQDLRGNISLLSYNAADSSLAWEQDNVGNRTTFTYGYDGVRNISNALATTVTDANSHRTAYWYDSAGRLSTVYDALGNYDAYTFDGNNNLTQKQDRRGFSWNNTYDGMGNVLTAADPYNNTTTTTYNSHNKPLKVTLPLGRSVTATYDGSDNLTQALVKDANGNPAAVTNYAYAGGYGLLTSKTDANSHTTLYGYDSNGYLNDSVTPAGRQYLWYYDALGFQTGRTDPLNRTTTYTPDAWERRVTTTYPGGGTHTFTYDPNGNLTRFTDGIGITTRSYDADNRLLEEDLGGVRVVSHSYDAAGQKELLATTTDYLGNVHSFTYTALDQISSASAAGQTVSYTYNPNGQVSQTYRPDGVRTDSYYINNGWHSSEYNIVNATGAVLSAYDYAFNADGQITYAQEGTSTNPATNNATLINYSYDGLGHLTNETRTGSVAPENISYVYDATGNRVSQSGSYLNGTFAYDADDELTSFTYSGASYASATFGYNANGERTTESTGLSPGFAGYATQFGYDFDGNLTGITAAGQSPVSFEYDGLDRQLGWMSGSARLDYQLDGNAPLTETNQTSSRMNLYGNGLVSTGGETLLYDGLGAVRQTTGSGPSVQWSGSYQAYGVASSASGSTGSHYQWGAASGYRADGFGPTYAAPLQKVGARYYDPEFGCFLTRDTDLSQRPYTYCDSDPINCTDPSGHTAKKKDKKPAAPAAPKAPAPEKVPAFVPEKLTIEISLDAKLGGGKAAFEYNGPAIWKAMSPFAKSTVHNGGDFASWVLIHEVL